MSSASWSAESTGAVRGRRDGCVVCVAMATHASARQAGPRHLIRVIGSLSRSVADPPNLGNLPDVPTPGPDVPSRCPNVQQGGTQVIAGHKTIPLIVALVSPTATGPAAASNHAR